MRRAGREHERNSQKEIGNMFGVGKCPKCEQVVSNIRLEEVGAASLMGKTFTTLLYLCPHCNTILSAQIDPIAVKTDTVSEIKGRG
jgi:hypothetical protein